MTKSFQFARNETPGCEHVLHFNNAGASLMPQPVIDAIHHHLQLEIYNGGYEAATMQDSLLQNFYSSAAKLINASPDEIAYMENATRAWDMVFYGLQFQRGDKILTCSAVYASNYIAFLQIAKKTGAIIEVIPNDAFGQVSIDALKKMIDSKVKMISITHIPTQGGLINPAKAVGKVANEAGIFYLLDATQSVGQLSLDVKKIGCDALCATGRKFLRGPRGTGFLYVNKRVFDVIDPPFLDLLSATWQQDNTYTLQPTALRFETWETSCANKIGLGVAIDYALNWGMDSIWYRISSLASDLRKKLRTIPGVSLHDLGEQQCGIITIAKENMEPEEIQKKLRAKNINVSVTLAEYARLDLEKRNVRALVRASVHYYNTEEEVDRFCEALEEL